MAEYIPGVCNIGSQEMNRRRRIGWIGLVVALVLFIFLLVLKVSHWWRLLIFFPATLSASGFLQAHFHFCSGFARKGVFNFGEIGKMHEVKDDLAQVKDKKRGQQITLYAAIIAAIVTIICIFIY